MDPRTVSREGMAEGRGSETERGRGGRNTRGDLRTFASFRMGRIRQDANEGGTILLVSQGVQEDRDVRRQKGGGKGSEWNWLQEGYA